MNYILGIDESGKSDLIGDLVISGAITNNLKLQKYKDSKKISCEEGQQILKTVSDEVEFFNKAITVDKIDQYVFSNEPHKNLNFLLIKGMAEVCAHWLNRLEIQIIYVDCPMNDIIKFNNLLDLEIRKYLIKPLIHLTIISTHRADEKYPIVALASISAKIQKTANFQIIQEKIKKEYNFFIKNGSVSDMLSKDFSKKFPKNPYTRKSWKIKIFK